MRTPALMISGIIMLLAFNLVGVAQKTDKVYLKNGDVVTGEIKSLKLAKLKFDMKGPGVISIKWEEIVRITSDKTFQVTLQNGQVMLAKLDTLFFESQHVRLDDIVEIVQIKNKFLKRLEGDIDLGFNYTKSSDIFQFNFASSITYRKPKVETNLKLNNILSKSSSDTITSKKQDATFGILRTLNNRFYLMSNLGWEENTQLGLENRFLLASSGGKILLNDNHKRLLTGGGISYNKEKTAENSGYNGNLEALAVIQFKKFRYSSPKVSIDAISVFYAGISDWGRLRMNLQVNTNIEVLKDFFVGLTLHDNFDNHTSSDNLSRNDYGITFNIGYEFGK
jgi:hypothetical protein